MSISKIKTGESEFKIDESFVNSSIGGSLTGDRNLFGMTIEQMKTSSLVGGTTYGVGIVGIKFSQEITPGPDGETATSTISASALGLKFDVSMEVDPDGNRTSSVLNACGGVRG